MFYNLNLWQMFTRTVIEIQITEERMGPFNTHYYFIKS